MAFSATSHGKGACDGLGGTVKCLAARATVACIYPYDEQIMTPRQLFEWASDNIPEVSLEYCSIKNYKHTLKNDSSNFGGFFELANFIPLFQSQKTM